MANYYEQCVVTPSIPKDQMTALERLFLGNIFEFSENENSVDFFASEGIFTMLYISPEDIAQAIEADRSDNIQVAEDNAALMLARNFLANHPDSEAEIDLQNYTISWADILKDIVARSPTIDEIVVHQALTCSTMRQDGFGGAVTYVTAAGHATRTTADLLTALKAEFAGTQSLLISGDIVDGITCHGPFNTPAEAVEWADRTGFKDWRIARLHPAES